MLRCGTLPDSWIPPGELRDQRELLRTRMALRDLRTSLKHCIHAGIDRYGLQADAISDLFGTKGHHTANGCRIESGRKSNWAAQRPGCVRF